MYWLNCRSVSTRSSVVFLAILTGRLPWTIWVNSSILNAASKKLFACTQVSPLWDVSYAKTPLCVWITYLLITILLINCLLTLRTWCLITQMVIQYQPTPPSCYWPMSFIGIPIIFPIQNIFNLNASLRKAVGDDILMLTSHLAQGLVIALVW